MSSYLKCRQKSLRFFLFITICMLVFGCTKPIQSPEDVYKIAVVAPQTGPYEILGNSIINGAELAVKEANNTSGIYGKTIDLVKEDDGGLVGEGAFFAYRLTSTEMILGVIGHLNSDISIPASEFYRRANIPEISPGSTSPYFTEREATKGFVFRTIGRDDSQGKLLAEYVKKKGFKRVAILYNDRAYGKSLAGEFAKSLKVENSNGVSPAIVFYDMIQVGKKDFGSLLSQISSSLPDVIFLAGEHDDAGNLVKDFNKYGLSMAKFLGGDGIDMAEFIKIGGKSTNGSVLISPAPIQDESFTGKYKEAYHEEPTGYAANSYDAANILINAMRKVKEKNPELIAKTIASTKDFKGVTGNITFDENGDLAHPAFVLSEIKDGKFMVIKNE